MVDLFITTLKDLERVAASHIQDIFPDAEIEAKPLGYKGIVLVKNLGDKEEAAKQILEKVPEVEKVFIVHGECNARLEEIVEHVRKIIKDRIKPSETFAVRTVRRGHHNFTSIDVNVATGSAVIEVTGASVNLDFPDKIVWIQILQDKAFISITSGEIEYKKMRPGKPIIRPFLSQLTLVQMPYLGKEEAVYKMGVRIGRAVQTLELNSLIIAYYKLIPAKELCTFLRGIFEGIESRYQIQLKAYAHKPRKVPVYVWDLYQLIRENFGKAVIIATSTRGDYITNIADKLIGKIREKRKVLILVGAHEGLPTGIFRFSDVTIDIAPSVTLSTEYAAISSIIALISVLESRGFFEKFREKK